MDYRKIATEILERIGGEDNVSHFEHCSTRLRFTLKDSNKVKVDELKQVKGVLGVVMGAQCQVIIGNNVVEVYDENERAGRGFCPWRNLLWYRWRRLVSARH